MILVIKLFSLNFVNIIVIKFTYILPVLGVPQINDALV